MAVGPYSITDYYMEAKRNQAEGTRNVSRVVKEVAEEFEKLSGRKYGLFEEYRMEDAERAADAPIAADIELCSLSTGINSVSTCPFATNEAKYCGRNFTLQLLIDFRLHLHL